jgi:hypothetical protein
MFNLITLTFDLIGVSSDSRADIVEFLTFYSSKLLLAARIASVQVRDEPRVHHHLWVLLARFRHRQGGALSPV